MLLRLGLLPRVSSVRLVSPLSALMSLIELSLMLRIVRLVSRLSALMSLIELP